MIPRLLGPSGLTGRYYIVTRYTEHDDGRIVAHEKHDVTATILDLLAEAEERGAAKVRDAVRVVADKWEAHANYVAGCYEGCSGVVDDLREITEARP